MTITGEQGQLRWGYTTAATVHPWTLIKADGQWTLSGTLASVDHFRVTQRPLVFVTPNAWRWPVEELQMTDATLTARLGPKEKTP
jgi:hypothetical protein